MRAVEFPPPILGELTNWPKSAHKKLTMDRFSANLDNIRTKAVAGIQLPATACIRPFLNEFR
jgi:hypothetical protein